MVTHGSLRVKDKPKNDLVTSRCSKSFSLKALETAARNTSMVTDWLIPGLGLGASHLNRRMSCYAFKPAAQATY